MKYIHTFSYSVFASLHTVFVLCVVYLNSASAQDMDSFQQQLEQQQQEILALKQRLDENNNPDPKTVNHADEHTLDISGFFDFIAHTTNNSGHPYDLGGLELDLQYDKAVNFTISAALTWDEEGSQVAVAVIDYHTHDHNVPVHGDIFADSGFHLQTGRFDVPFGIDYVYFAAPDRPNVTAPLTTERIQDGGFSGDGVRSYGTWSIIDYVFYWTNSLYDDNGSSIGARIGLFPKQDNFCSHRTSEKKNFVVGMSWLRDMDSDENERNTVYAFDMSWQLGMAELIYELTILDSVNEVILPDSSSAGPADEEGFNIRLLFDLDPTTVFVSYGEWKPDYSARLDESDDSISYSVSKLERLTLGTQYTFNQHLQVKLEYYHHMDTETSEPDFEKRRLTFQVVANF